MIDKLKTLIDERIISMGLLQKEIKNIQQENYNNQQEKIRKLIQELVIAKRADQARKKSENDLIVELLSNYKMFCPNIEQIDSFSQYVIKNIDQHFKFDYLPIKQVPEGNQMEYLADMFLLFFQRQNITQKYQEILMIQESNLYTKVPFLGLLLKWLVELSQRQFSDFVICQSNFLVSQLKKHSFDFYKKIYRLKKTNISFLNSSNENLNIAVQSFQTPQETNFSARETTVNRIQFLNNINQIVKQKNSINEQSLNSQRDDYGFAQTQNNFNKTTSKINSNNSKSGLSSRYQFNLDFQQICINKQSPKELQQSQQPYLEVPLKSIHTITFTTNQRHSAITKENQNKTTYNNFISMQSSLESRRRSYQQCESEQQQQQQHQQSLIIKSLDNSSNSMLQNCNQSFQCSELNPQQQQQQPTIQIQKSISNQNANQNQNSQTNCQLLQQQQSFRRKYSNQKIRQSSRQLDNYRQLLMDVIPDFDGFSSDQYWIAKKQSNQFINSLSSYSALEKTSPSYLLCVASQENNKNQIYQQLLKTNFFISKSIERYNAIYYKTHPSRLSVPDQTTLQKSLDNISNYYKMNKKQSINANPNLASYQPANQIKKKQQLSQEYLTPQQSVFQPPSSSSDHRQALNGSLQQEIHSCQRLRPNTHSITARDKENSIPYKINQKKKSSSKQLINRQKRNSQSNIQKSDNNNNNSNDWDASSMHFYNNCNHVNNTQLSDTTYTVNNSKPYLQNFFSNKKSRKNKIFFSLNTSLELDRPFSQNDQNFFQNNQCIQGSRCKCNHQVNGSFSRQINVSNLYNQMNLSENNTHRRSDDNSSVSTSKALILPQGKFNFQINRTKQSPQSSTNGQGVVMSNNLNSPASPECCDINSVNLNQNWNKNLKENPNNKMLNEYLNVNIQNISNLNMHNLIELRKDNVFTYTNQGNKKINQNSHQQPHQQQQQQIQQSNQTGQSLATQLIQNVEKYISPNIKNTIKSNNTAFFSKFGNNITKYLKMLSPPPPKTPNQRRKVTKNNKLNIKYQTYKTNKTNIIEQIY